MKDNKCKGCKDGLESMLANQDELMKKYGWMIHYVTPDEEYPYGANIHTHGFKESFGHPDIQICAPLSPDVVQGILNTIAGSIKAGKIFKANRKYNNIIEKFPVLMRSTREGGRGVLRMVFPDKNGNFNSVFSKAQAADIT